MAKFGGFYRKNNPIEKKVNCAFFYLRLLYIGVALWCIIAEAALPAIFLSQYINIVTKSTALLQPYITTTSIAPKSYLVP
jgi:hypothetical protein